MESTQVELAITISSTILFVSSEIIGKSSCEYNSIMDLIIEIGLRCKKKKILMIFRKYEIIKSVPILCILQQLNNCVYIP